MVIGVQSLCPCGLNLEKNSQSLPICKREKEKNVNCVEISDEERKTKIMFK